MNNMYRVTTIDEDLKKLGLGVDRSNNRGRIVVLKEDATPEPKDAAGEDEKDAKDGTDKPDAEAKDEACDDEKDSGEGEDKEDEKGEGKKKMPAFLKMAAKAKEKEEPAKKEENVWTSISNLLGEARKHIQESQPAEAVPDASDAIKGFAMISLTADSLAEEFTVFAEASDSKEIEQLAEMFDKLAEEAADSARSMLEIAESEEFEPNFAVVEQDFSGMTEALCEGLEVYADLLEAQGGEPTASMTSDEDAKGDEGGAKDTDHDQIAKNEDDKEGDEMDERPHGEPDGDEDEVAKIGKPDVKPETDTEDKKSPKAKK